MTEPWALFNVISSTVRSLVLVVSTPIVTRKALWVLGLLALFCSPCVAESEVRRLKLRNGEQVVIEGSVERASLRKVKGYRSKKVKGFRLRHSGSPLRHSQILVCQSTCSPLVTTYLESGALTDGMTVLVSGVRQGRGVVYAESVTLVDTTDEPSGGGSVQILYLATLRPPAGVVSSGSGFATVRLNESTLDAWVAFEYSGLSSGLTAMHIHDRLTGGVLFDLDEAVPDAEGVYHWHIEPTPQYTAAEVISFLNQGKAYINFHTEQNPAGEIEGTFSRQGIVGRSR
jgi:CHRD domain